MYQTAGAIILVGVSVLFMIAAKLYEQNTDEFSTFKGAMRLCFQFMALFFAVISLNYGVLVLESSGASANMITTFNTAYLAYVVIIGLAFMLSLVMFIKELFTAMSNTSVGYGDHEYKEYDK